MKTQDPWQNRDIGVWPPPPTVNEPPPPPKPPAMKVWKAIAGCMLVSGVIGGVLFVALTIVGMIAGFGGAIIANAVIVLFVAAPLLSGVCTAFVWRRGNMSRWRRLACMSGAIGLLSAIIGLGVYVISHERYGRETLGWTSGLFVYITLVELVGLGVMGAILRRRDARRAAEMAQAPPNWPPAPGAGDVIPPPPTWPPTAGGLQPPVPPTQTLPSTTNGAQPPEAPEQTASPQPPVGPWP